MTKFMCTYAYDSENIVVFDFDLESNEMEEAIGEALCLIAKENGHDVSTLVGFSVLRIDG